MATVDARTILKDGHVGPQVERLTNTGTSLKPGSFVDVNADGKFIAVAIQGSDVPTQLLLEDRYQYSHPNGGVDQAYTADRPAVAEYPPAGALRYVRVPNGTTTVKGSKLIFNNAGLLVVAPGAGTTPVPLKVVAVAEEAITASGEQLILARIA